MHLEPCEHVVKSSYVISLGVVYQRTKPFGAQLYLCSGQASSVLTRQERNHRIIGSFRSEKTFKIIKSNHKETAMEEKILCRPVQAESKFPLQTFSMKLPFHMEDRTLI